MACDLQMTQAGWIKWKCKTKIFRINDSSAFPDNFLVGFSGTAGDMMDAVDYLRYPEHYKKAPILTSEGLVLTEKGVIYHFTKLDKWSCLDTPFAGIGSGSPVALGALETGATPVEAIKIAMRRDAFTGMGTKSYSW
jgi:20S proteasome alpha/beta subunit